MEQASLRKGQPRRPHHISGSRRSMHTRSCSAYVFGRMLCCRVLCQWLRYRRSLTSFETTVSGCQRLHEPADTIQRHVLLIAFLQYEFCKCYLFRTSVSFYLRRVAASVVFICAAVAISLPGQLARAIGQTARQPNIVLILADDMGSGDVQALNPLSKIPTPNLNKLAADGMTFTDGHFTVGRVHAYSIWTAHRTLLLANGTETRRSLAVTASRCWRPGVQQSRLC